MLEQLAHALHRHFAVQCLIIKHRGALAYATVSRFSLGGLAAEAFVNNSKLAYTRTCSGHGSIRKGRASAHFTQTGQAR
jgi:hypothetical protein